MKNKPISNKNRIVLNKKHPAFQSGYNRIYCNSYNTSEFNNKIKRDKDGKYYIYIFLVDQYFFETYYNNIHLFKVYLGYLSPTFPDAWKEEIIKSLNKQLQPYELVRSTSEFIYYYMLSAYIANNDYWSKCEYKTVKDCKNSINTFCQKRHGNMIEGYPELALTGHHRDEPGYQKSWKWIPMIEDREYEQTDDYFDFIEKNIGDILSTNYKDYNIPTFKI